jgi:hypothetical protein
LQGGAGEWVKKEAGRLMAEGRREMVVDASFWWKGQGERGWCGLDVFVLERVRARF